MNEKDPIDRELRNLLSVDPSPGFEGRVRAHVFRQPKASSSNFRWGVTAAAAAVVAAVVAAVLVFLPQRVSQPDVKVTASAVPSPAPLVEPVAQPEAAAAHHRIAKPKRAAKAEPQLIIAANEVSAMRRLFSGEITKLPSPFEPEVREFRAPQTVIEPLPPLAAVTIDPIEPLPLAGQ